MILRGNEFSFAEGCGDRPVVSIGGCQRVLIVGQNKFVSGGKQPALALDPVNMQNRTISSPNGPVFLAPMTELEGELTLSGRAPTEEELGRLRREGADKPEEGG